MRSLIAFAGAAVTLLALDAIWLTSMASTYRRLFAGNSSSRSGSDPPWRSTSSISWV